jgi:hypothetical protein
MYEKLLNEAEKFLESQKVKELPILDMWEGLTARAGQLKIEMPENLGDFECLLEADKRFTLVDSKVVDEVDVLDAGEEEGEYEVSEDYFEVEELEKIGFNQHQIVGLKKYEKKKVDDDDDDDVVQVKSGSTAKTKIPSKTLTKKVSPKTVKPKSLKKKKK